MALGLAVAAMIAVTAWIVLRMESETPKPRRVRVETRDRRPRQ